MKRRNLLAGAILGVSAVLAGLPALAADEPLKVGLILPMTGPFASTGRQIEAAAKLYIAEHGASVAGREVELLVKDDAGVADTTKRLAQELIVKDKVAVLAGFGLTPLAMATAPLATRAKVPAVVMAAATSSITEQSPYIVRTSYTTPQVTSKIAEWAAKEGIRSAVTIVSDYGPGIDAEKTFVADFSKAGGQVSESLRVPLANPDFSPFLQKVADQKPDAIFVFVPSGVGAPFMKQYVERGLDKSGVRLLADGGITDDDILNGMGDPALAAITGFHYSAAHSSPENRAFVEAFTKANPGMRPNFMAAGGYDGMHAIYAALEKTGGKSDGDSLMEAMKGLSWISPRGPITIDPETRDIVQNVYMRKVERVNGELWNVEFETFEAVKDPGKADS
ncbi:ABC transporter substrate-binding protein [Haematobacter massiliensis]|uniref:ABC transporter substrate-binding protein n=3 Tax=Haematobacter massiliensis TaxID=195105 RepID=A0A086Y6N4_9RHOB|nr:ABC transporter substrate-binding protein [Haematobacter massiliensis]KFI29934.1 ABC transporter substrate-binding protein [Haematobacter massiliensis]OWJ72927.1 ABC transporter substrate-binding protein [Haematobacter massiliensis]OWJ81411.1 ABC transporter substrate-binding protein [Haematobacter massiliensis]